MITIGRARINDIQGIKAVLAATWVDTYASFLSESSIARVTAEWHSPSVLAAEIDRPSTFAGVAKSVSSEIVGMITAHSQGELLLISRLYVLPKHQRKGIGERLMEESLRAFPQTRRVQLDVEEENPKGRAFYRKLGFKEVRVKIDDLAGTKLNSIVLEKHR
ncbi:MAG: N-acetyltransferase family protein [Candidatus Binatia bacterium]